ncbi:MAG TPA: shikimate dehydrogenase [Oscillospiraceae bacterium]|nr:shikimate dehydrogenase [Oscillospiraceae bacterium]
MSRKFALIGYPLKHTMSPPIHKRLFELSGKTGEYSVIEIPPEKLPESMGMLNSLDGYNVTIPHKIAVIPFLDSLDGSAKRYGAVNCVSKDDGEKIGFNTDCLGFLRSLDAAGLSLDGKVLLLGLGGAGRMMAVESAINGAELTIAVRDHSLKAAEEFTEEIIKHIPDASLKVIDINSVEGSFDLMINATPVGMFPETDKSPVGEDIVKNCGALFDAIYNPTKTVLMDMFIKTGKKAVGGMAMLVWQAAAAHEIWDNAEYDEKDINALVSEMEKLLEEKFR